MSQRFVAYLDWLEAALAKAIREQRVGAPVSLRLFCQLTADHGLLAPLAAWQLEAAGRCFATPVASIYAQGGPAAGCLSVLAEYTGGQTALIVAEVCRNETPWTLALLVGNQGTLQFEDTPGAVTLGSLDARLRRWVESSLETGGVAHVR